jgi:hypothetical protein
MCGFACVAFVRGLCVARYMTDWVGIGTSSHAMLTSKFRTVEPPVGGGDYPYEEVEGGACPICDDSPTRRKPRNPLQ